MITPGFVSALLASGLCGVLIVAIVEKLIPIVPSIGIYLFLGLMADNEISAVIRLVIVSALGSMLGSLCWYLLARLSRAYPRLEFCFDVIRRFSAMRHAADWYSSNMRRMALVQLIPVARAYAGLASGIVAIDMTRFIVATFLGCVIWNGVLIFAGWTIKNL